MIELNLTPITLATVSFWLRLELLAFGLLWLPASATCESKLRILTTFAPIDSLTRNIAGDAAVTEMLIPPDSDPHNFALSPRDLKKVAAADVVISNGLGIDNWMDRAISSGAKPGVMRIISGEGLADGNNPHVWLDPGRAIKQVEAICRGLVAADPPQAEIFQRNAAAFTARLRQLDNDLAVVTAAVENKRVVAFHDSFYYFAQRYGFEIIAVYQKVPGREPAPRELNQLRRVLLKGGAQLFFSEPGYPTTAFRSISSDLKMRVVILDPIEGGRPGAELYEKAMRANLASLEAAGHD